MNEKPRLFVFAPMEIILIFMFMVFIALTAFVFGVKIGKITSFEDLGISKEEVAQVELMSVPEEVAHSDRDPPKAKASEGMMPKPKQDLIDTTYKQLKEEFDRLDQHEAMARKKALPAAPSPREGKGDDDTDQNRFKGKYTIQLGSYRSLEDAEKFADGFRVRGYGPIINEVRIKNRGTWYRVGLGVFNSVQEAKDYITHEETLFQGQDFVIGQFDFSATTNSL